MTVEKLDWGPPKLRAWADAVVDAINANQPIAGANIDIAESESGAAISLAESGAAGGGVDADG